MPCRNFCQEVQDACYGKGDKLNIDCEIFLEDPSKCLPAPTTPTTTTTSTTTVTPVTTTPVMSTTPFKEECRPISIEWCRHFGHVNGSAPNIWGSSDESQTLQLFTEYGQPVVSTGCSPSAFFYICAVLFPNCDGDEAGSFYPCKSVCEEYNAKCANETGFFEQQCDVLGTVAEDPYCLLPPSKAVCKSDEFACEGVPRCISSSLVCDRKDDCGDFSDERNCDCNADFEFQCDMGLCVRNYKRCDNNTDCPDRSDELGCSHCRNNQFKCNDGTCIMAEWVCDGLADCPVSESHRYLDFAEDEENCSVCSFTDEFTCISGKCIPWEQKCDGTPQCKDHTDEANCIHQGPPTFVNIDGDVTPICATNFTAKHADVACQRLGMSGAITWKQLRYEGYPHSWFQVAENGTVKTVVGTGTLVDSCDGPFGVDLICAPSECGKRQTSVNIITNGMDARPREVPWQASIQEFGKHFCGASLVHPYFVVTAAHCVEKYIMNFEYVEIVLGAVDLKASDEAGRRTFTVKRIISHPEYLTFQGNDIALIELTSNVTFSADIQPLCLRRPGDVFTRASECYTAGWGKMDPDSNAMATKLQLVKMTVWDSNKCNSSFAWDGQLQDTEICAGYYAGIKAACRGDSGGPLYCFDNDFTWRLVGVASYVHVGCNKPEKPVVFTDAVRYNDWIANNTVCEFQCASGRCLFDRNMVCNKVDDCGDNSDETDPCDVSANCTFDEPYLCGYRTNWLWVSDSLLANRYPLFDHSVGRFPGMFLLGAFRGHNLQTPRIDLTSPHCMRFRYHMRGTIAQGLAVHAHELSRKKWKKVWHEEPQEGPDRWLLGQFDLEAGNYDIAFRAYDDGVATLDDTQLLPGRCKDHGCGAGEFACNTSGVWNCLADAQRCNNVIDCDDASDELTCTASRYKCDFENGVLCSLEQNSFDSTAGEWHMINASRAGFDDVTFANGTGNMLRIVTERLLKTDFVYMEQDLYLGGQNHCLSFSYYSTSTIKFTVLFIPKEGRNYADNAEVILSFENRQTSGWSKTHASLPAKVEGHLYYEVVGRELNRSVIHPMVSLDDITIIPGVCPVLTCPAGQTVCSTEAYCLDDSRFCDSHIDCLDAADEVNCVCNDQQYKCPDGPCIAKEKTCDHVTDCPDASDEGSECDSLRTVDCDFEHPFMCGYTDNGTRSESVPYIWTREQTTPSREPINVGTGPMDDHTFGNGSGHWAFANGENGHPYQYVALESPPFSSTGNEVLVFYYFAYSMFSQFWITGSLGLLTRDHERNTESGPWFIIVDRNNTWRSACVALPQSSNLTVAFVAMRGEAQRADLAVDDVKVLQTTCDMFYKESRLSMGAATGPPEPTPTPPSGCPSGQRACRSGMCLPESDFCNGYPDCPDRFDEMLCNNEG
ncbi:hypothetical protein V1264_024973 [Littorina saxatilis]|uniref:Uncharacterized protein n=2 Tax=Littorina saxatilis TaxID=31220 RepID=A0AAN9ALH6_9CAEN